MSARRQDGDGRIVRCTSFVRFNVGKTAEFRRMFHGFDPAYVAKIKADKWREKYAQTRTARGGR